MEDIIKKMYERGVIIYGGGRIGKQIIKELQNNHIPLVSVWDRNAENISNVEKIKLPDYQYSEKETVIIICIFSEKICEEIKEELKNHAFQTIISIYSEELSVLHCNLEKKNFNFKRCRKCILTTGGCKEYIMELKKDREQYIDEIDTLFLAPTLKCTLNCIHCAQHTGEYKKKKIDVDWDYEIFKKVWKKAEQVFGWIKEVRFGSGELFLYKDWEKIVRICLDSEWIGSVGIITNGIHSLSEEQYFFLSDPKIVVLLDDYSSKLEEKQKQLLEKTKEFFYKYNVNFAVLDNNEGTWYAFGEIKDYHLKETELKYLYQKCVVNRCFFLTSDYQFSICGRANIAKDLGYIDTTKEDCIELMSYEDVEKIREKIRTLLKKDHLEICRYCAGCCQIIAAGEQNKRERT